MAKAFFVVSVFIFFGALLVAISDTGDYGASTTPNTSYRWSAAASANSAPAAVQRRPEEYAEIVDWNWRKDPSFGTRGTILWTVEVRNTSDRYMESVRVDMTTYDAGGGLVSSNFTYVTAIPPGETRSSQSYADLYRTEETARAVVASARFAR